MGSPEVARRYLEWWTSQADPDFDPSATRNFEATCCAQYVRDIKAETGTFSCNVLTTQRIANEYWTVHGAFFTALTDTVTSGSVASLATGPWVSVSMSCDFFAPMPIGEVMDVRARVVKYGKVISQMQSDFIRRKTGQLVARGRHVVKMTGDRESI